MQVHLARGSLGLHSGHLEGAAAPALLLELIAQLLVEEGAIPLAQHGKLLRAGQGLLVEPGTVVLGLLPPLGAELQVLPKALRHIADEVCAGVVVEAVPHLKVVDIDPV